MTTGLHEHLVHSLLNASANMLQFALKQAQADDEAAVAVLSNMLQAGAMVSLITTLAPATGLAQLRIEIVEPNGAAHQLMACELQRETK
jgi:hypothetical protein